MIFFFSSRRRHTRYWRDWSSDVCSSDLNSTQIEGGETLSFPEGMGFPVDPTREIVTNIHYLNTRAEDQRIEVVYDFFTMSEADRKSVVQGKSVDLGGRRIIKKTNVHSIH